MHPDYRGRGVGTLLTRPGLEVADQLGVPVYLEATGRAVKLYQKLGFEKQNQGVILSPEIVGDSQQLEAPVMIRMPIMRDGTSDLSVEDWTRSQITNQ